ncbi:unnamed protein product [Linum trigynum]|uniref:Uncharacterized protein n=1 Tax=Linum trigynum TaxID=586398 RepID=A0AAV2CAA4_9ROSI
MISLKGMSTSLLSHRRLIPLRPFFIASFSTLVERSTGSSTAALVDCLITTFEFPETQAVSIAARFLRRKSSQKPQALYAYLRDLGFSHDHIQSTISGAPQILFGNVDKNLKPKIELFQKLGLEGPRLGKFLSKNAAVLTASLEKRMRPRLQILRDNFSEKDVVRAAERCNWIIYKFPDSRLLSNIALLKSCGIVGSQLSMLLRMQPRVFLTKESELRGIVSRTLDFGFSVESRMFVHGLYTVSGWSDATLNRKFAIFEGFGFSRGKCIAMFRIAPGMMRLSSEKLRFGVDFFLNTVKLTKEAVVRRPGLLMYSMEERVIPRYRVVEIMESKGLFKKKPNFSSVVNYTTEQFVQKFVFMYLDHAEELLMAHNGHNVDLSKGATCV